VGFYILADAYDSEIASGGGFQLGGGLDFWLNPCGQSEAACSTTHSVHQLQRAAGRQVKLPLLSTVSLEANAQIHF